MAKKTSLLDQMRANPKGNWQIKDVEKLCREAGLVLLKPSSGSHYRVTSDALHGILTVPFKRPIKQIYIKKLIAMADAHVEVRRKAKEARDV